MDKDLSSLTKNLGAVSVITNTVGSAVNDWRAGSAKAASGRAAQQADENTANALEARASSLRGSAQQQAHFDLRGGRLAASRALAVAAASGGGAADPTIVNLISDLKGQAEYQALSDLYSGESSARGLENQASIARYNGAVSAYGGKLDRAQSRTKALNTIIDSNISTMFRKFGNGGPPQPKPYETSYPSGYNMAYAWLGDR